MFRSLSCLLVLITILALEKKAVGQENYVDPFKVAVDAMSILQFEEKILPLTTLDTLRIAVVHTDDDETTGVEFGEILKQYAPISQFDIAELKAFQSAHEDNPYNFVIYSFEQVGDITLGKLMDFDDILMPGTRSVGVVVASDRDQDHFQQLQGRENFPRLKALVQLKEGPWGEAVAAQAIVGAISTKSWIRPESKNSKNTALQEVEHLAQNRLGFSSADWVGMDAELLTDSIKAIVEEGIMAGAYPGAQVVVARKGKVIYHQAFGYHTYDSLQEVALDDLYDYASVTKVTSALPALMQLYGDGQFDLDAKMKDYFPDFKRTNKADLTFRSMLAHNARLRPWVPYWKGALRGNAKYPWKKRWKDGIINDGRFKRKTMARDSSEDYTIRLTDDLWLHRDFKERNIVKSIKKSPLNEKPGYVYSGLLFYLLPDLVARKTQSDFETYIKENIYHKIGAYTITYNPLRFYPKSRIIPTERDSFFRMQQLHGVVHDEGAAMMAGVSSNAGLFSTPLDLTKLMQLYLNEGAYGSEQVLPSEAVREFTRCQYCEEGNRRGLGFDKPLIEYDANLSSVAKDASPESFGHSGYTGTFAWVDPAQELIFVFCSNRVYPTRENRKLYQLGIRPRIHQVLYDAIIEDKK